MDVGELIIVILEIIGTVSFSVSGAMVAINKKLDIFGVLTLGVTTAIGGGIMRDIILGQTPPRSFLHYEYFLIAVATALIVFMIAFVVKDKFLNRQDSIENVNNVFDAVGLSVFTVAGIDEGLKAGFSENMFLLVFLGVITGVGGGVLRDIMVHETPFILRKRVYAVAAIIGGCVYYLLQKYVCSMLAAVAISVAATVGIRVCATVFKWSLPKVNK